MGTTKVEPMNHPARLLPPSPGFTFWWQMSCLRGPSGCTGEEVSRKPEVGEESPGQLLPAAEGCLWALLCMAEATRGALEQLRSTNWWFGATPSWASLLREAEEPPSAAPWSRLLYQP